MNISAINTDNSTLTINNELLLSFAINEESKSIELIHSDIYYFLSTHSSIFPYNNDLAQSRSEKNLLYKYVN
jgi:hypothetical protein